ncbi:MAG: nitroreductase family deazaflavin-dependent oxidoreductase [Acidimicrobiales bacterium]
MKRVLCTMVLAVATTGIVFVMGLRRKSPPVLRVIRRMNHTVFNPRQMESAGTPGAYASIIRHSGRTTGRAYETPIQAVTTDEGFLIGLPYGGQADWLKNVFAAGTATLVTEGQTHAVDQPKLIPIEAAADHYSPQEQRSHRLFGVDQALLLRRVNPEEAA